uniref:Uncharacterized protein n=2 Tax=unclassified Candidatus Kentrum TaxID=2643149 RepID=A0A451A712_9GAMM|nr:MAG: hypothetical protein BECKLPF1236A_GA0070988_1000910 [Candidatus Kentron sp. LPFa]VFK24220.1 MAG: hypothetical protein BECKLPF1236C_GA0070990_1001114 [Candidatus Kentron sp. LPFa]VFK61826.1 MAG: hypothetical protein BECKUNK1418G_GA0071005_101926 [Candidatus Kentron sp. UNK]VFK70010.1 MAG: hypothetical protein BECKUNK1418H_GA0071006_102226 [Candidatus Kentron sp. UNK]
MTGDGSRAPNNTSLPNMNTSCNRYTPCNGCMSTDIHIVSNLYLIIYFHTIFNDGVFERTPVYGSIRPNLYIVANSHCAKLRYFYPYTIIIGNSKTITADYNPRVNKRLSSYNGASAKCYIGY